MINQETELNYMYGQTQEPDYVLVETVDVFRHRYLIKTPHGKDEWALDTVTCDEAVEFSQKYLGETIISHRRITKEEALKLSDIDNDYSIDWDESQKIAAFFSDPILEDGTIDKNRNFEDL